MLNLADNLLEHIDQAAFEPLKRLKGKKHVIKTNMIRIYCSKYVLFFKCFVLLLDKYLPG